MVSLYLFACFAVILDVLNIPSVNTNITDAINVYSSLLTNAEVEATKQSSINKGYVMLNELKNSKHTVITSLAILAEKDGEYTEYIDYDKADVYVKDISAEEILNWIEIGNPYDKEGAYAIQSQFGVYIEKIEGNYFTVVGLPIHKLYDVIKKIDD